MKITIKVAIIAPLFFAYYAHAEMVQNINCDIGSVKIGNVNSEVLNNPSSGKVTITIDSRGFISTVNYDGRFTITGKLDKKIDAEIYIEDFDGEKNSYPFTRNRLRLNRYSGEGYFQSSTYKTAYSTPEFVTENLRKCKLSQPRF